MKKLYMQKNENIALKILFWGMLADLLVFIPEQISTVCKILFIAFALVNIVKDDFLIRFGKVERTLFSVIILFSTVTLLFNCFSIGALLAVGQLLVINFLLLAQDKAKMRESFVAFLNRLEKIVFCGIVYSSFLLVFGKKAFIDGKWINYFISPAFGQVGHGMQDNLGYSSYFTNPNPFSFFIAVIIAWRVINYRRSAKWWIAFVIYILGLQIADSRAGDICAIIGIIIVICWRLDNRKVRKLITVGSIMLGLIYVIVAGEQMVKMLLNIDLAGRLEKWNLLLNAFKKSPLIGNGYSSSTKVILKGVSTGTFSSYLTIAAEEGIIGLIAAFVAYTTIVVKLKKSSQNLDNLLAIFAFVYAVQIGVLGIVEDVLFNVTSRFLILEIVAKIALDSPRSLMSNNDMG